MFFKIHDWEKRVKKLRENIYVFSGKKSWFLKIWEYGVAQQNETKTTIASR